MGEPLGQTMTFEWLTLSASLAYLLVLFVIAFFADRQAEQGRSLANNPYVYSLSLAVYCTSWTFYGSVGRAATTGIGFLPIYLGPTLLFLLAPFFLRKIIKIANAQRTTSISDFISSRYGKSQSLAGLVTIVAVVGIMPYIALQLKAISTTFDVLKNYPSVASVARDSGGFFTDTAFVVTLMLALFTVLFGTRRLDASEHHEGLMVAIAFESLVKLFAFLAVGFYVTFFMFGGFGDVYANVIGNEKLAPLLSTEQLFSDGSWTFLMLLSALAIFCLPRQFQVTVVESTRVSHLDKAMWLFPLYLLAINIFVLPIAIGGLVTFPDGSVSADTFVLALPMVMEKPSLALMVYLGGLSAASGMVIVAAVALSTMVCNDLVVPLLLRLGLWRKSKAGSASRAIILIRRINIFAILFLSYSYFRGIGDSYTLVTIGLVSFSAAAQFGPLIIGGVFWKGASKFGALAGLMAGFLVWGYTLLLPSFAQSGWLPMSLVEQGPWAIHWLRPQALFGLEWGSALIHSLFWSLFANISFYLLVSLFSRQNAIEVAQANAFVDVFEQHTYDDMRYWQGDILVRDLENTVGRFVGTHRFQAYLAQYNTQHDEGLSPDSIAPNQFIIGVERMLAGVVGSASARLVINTGFGQSDLDVHNVLDIIDEASHAVVASREVLEAVVENVDQGICMFDPDGKLLTWNNRFVDLIGYDRDQIVLGMDMSAMLRLSMEKGDFGHIDNPESFISDQLDNAFEPSLTQYEMRMYSGEVIEVLKNPVADGGVVFTYTDISERKQSEQELAKLRTLLSSIIDSMPSVLIGVDPKGVVTHWNHEAEKIYQKAAADAVGQWLPSLIVQLPNVEQLVDRAIRDEASVKLVNQVWQIESLLKHMDVTIYPLLAEGIRGAVIRLDDVTEKKRLEEMMVQSEKMLSVGGLAAGMAHEINNPLAGILQNVQVIKVRVSESLEKNRHIAAECGTSIESIRYYMKQRGLIAMLDMISESGERASKIVNNMLGFSRKSEFSYEKQDVALLLDETVEMASNDYSLKHDYDFKKIDIVRRYETGMPPVWCEGNQLKQVFLNLLKNGAHAMIGAQKENAEAEPPRHHFILRIYRRGESAVIEVEDNGPGMDKHVRRRLFEPFFTTKKVGSGTGLGLSVSFFIVTQNHQGSMEIKSTEGQGSCFIIRLPLEAPTELA